MTLTHRKRMVLKGLAALAHAIWQHGFPKLATVQN